MTQLLSNKTNIRRRHFGLATNAIIAIALVGIIVVGGLWIAGGYNTLVGKETQVEQTASNIESAMKRRADLIPNLVGTVKGYAKHEKGIYSDIAQARSRLLASNVQSNPGEAAAANAGFNASLGRLLAIAENYPQLKADKNFMALQDEIAGSENRINYARVEYNNAVKDYNQTVRSFPTNIVAGMTGFQRKAFFEASSSEKETPKVEFE